MQTFHFTRYIGRSSSKNDCTVIAPTLGEAFEQASKALGTRNIRQTAPYKKPYAIEIYHGAHSTLYSFPDSDDCFIMDDFGNAVAMQPFALEYLWNRVEHFVF